MSGSRRAARVRGLALGVGFLLAALRESPGGSGWEVCLSGPSSEAQQDCLLRLWPRPPREEGGPGALLERDAGLVERLAARWLEAPAALTPEVRAAALEWRARALAKLGRAEEAADTWRESLVVDDETSRLTWLRADGSTVASLKLGIGGGRLLRAAESLLAVGLREQALELVREMAALGDLERAGEFAARAGVPDVLRAFEPREVWSAPRWYPPVPALEIRLLDGQRISLAALRGHVVLIDFWASWCAPCLKELPRMQELYRAERERGLVAITVNAQEPASVARRTAEALGLELPIGVYDGAVDDAFRVRQLPTVILVDREGKIRERWNGYAEGLEASIAAKARLLLAEEGGAETVELARVLQGGEGARVLWWRELPAPPLGLAVVAAEDGTPRIAATTPRRVLALDAHGQLLGGFEVGRGAGTLVRVPADGEGSGWLATYLPGTSALTLIDARDGSTLAWEASQPLTDVHAAGPELWIATLGGLFAVSVPGLEARSLWPRPVLALGRLGADRALLLGREGNLWRWPDGEAPVGPAPPRAWKLLPTDGGELVVVPSDVASATRVACAGQWRGIALGLASGQLLVVEDPARRVWVRSLWEDIRQVGAGDLDGDGCDEVLVGFGRGLAAVALRSRGVPADPPPPLGTAAPGRAASGTRPRR